jgi:hypothetical protein
MRGPPVSDTRSDGTVDGPTWASVREKMGRPGLLGRLG